MNLYRSLTTRMLGALHIHIHFGAPMANDLWHSPDPIYSSPRAGEVDISVCTSYMRKLGPQKRVMCPETQSYEMMSPRHPHIYQFSAHTVFIFPRWEFSLCFLRRQYNKPEFWLQLYLHRSIADIRQNHRHQSTWQILILYRNYRVLPWLGGKCMGCSESTRYRHQGHPVFGFILRPLGASST